MQSPARKQYDSSTKNEKQLAKGPAILLLARYSETDSTPEDMFNRVKMWNSFKSPPMN